MSASTVFQSRFSFPACLPTQRPRAHTRTRAKSHHISSIIIMERAGFSYDGVHAHTHTHTHAHILMRGRAFSFQDDIPPRFKDAKIETTERHSSTQSDSHSTHIFFQGTSFLTPTVQCRSFITFAARGRVERRSLPCAKAHSGAHCSQRRRQYRRHHHSRRTRLSRTLRAATILPRRADFAPRQQISPAASRLSPPYTGPVIPARAHAPSY